MNRVIEREKKQKGGSIKKRKVDNLASIHKCENFAMLMDRKRRNSTVRGVQYLDSLQRYLHHPEINISTNKRAQQQTLWH